MPHRIPLIFTLCTLAAASLSAAPVTLKELDLMIRMQVPDAEVLHDVAERRLLAPLDASAERQLTGDGASAGLISKLKAAGNFALPPEQAAAAQRFTDEQNARVAREKAADAAALLERESRRLAQTAPPAPPAPPAAPPPASAAPPLGQPLDNPIPAPSMADRSISGT